MDKQGDTAADSGAKERSYRHYSIILITWVKQNFLKNGFIRNALIATAPILSFGFVLTLVFGNFLPFLFQCVSIINCPLLEEFMILKLFPLVLNQVLIFSTHSHANNFFFSYVGFLCLFFPFVFQICMPFLWVCFQCHCFLPLLWKMLLEKEKKGLFAEIILST